MSKTPIHSAVSILLGTEVAGQLDDEELDAYGSLAQR